jgi:VanZ family protein
VSIKTNFLLAFFYSIFILFISLIKIELQTDVSYLDKLVHTAIYFFFCLIWYIPFKDIFINKTLIYLFIFSILFGVFIEFLQEKVVHYRAAELLDIWFNALGTIIGCSFLLLKNSIKKS